MACVCAAIAAAAFQKTHLKKNREPTHDVDFLVKQSDSIYVFLVKSHFCFKRKGVTVAIR